MKKVLSSIKYSNDRDKLKETVRANEGFRHLERDAVDVLDACTSAKLTVNQEDEEAVDVCQAIQEMIDEAAKEAAEKASHPAREAGSLSGRAGGGCSDGLHPPAALPRWKPATAERQERSPEQAPYGSRISQRP